MRIYSVINGKGGVGKTTIAVNLAACVGSGRVLLADVDPQGSAVSWMNRVGDSTIDFTVASTAQQISRLRELQHRYDVIVVDTIGSHHAAQDLLGVVAEISDVVLVPIEPAYLSIGPLRTTLDLVERAGSEYRVVISRVHPSSNLEPTRRLLAGANIASTATAIRSYAALAELPLAGKVVSELGWSSTSRKAKKDFAALLHEIEQVPAATTPAGSTTCRAKS